VLKSSAKEPSIHDSDAITILDRKSAKPPKCYHDCEADVVDWILSPLSNPDRERFESHENREGDHGKAIHKSFDCSIMDLADDIAYGVHDLEDSIALCLISEPSFRAEVTEDKCASFLDYLKSRYPTESQNNVYDIFVRDIFSDGRTRKRTISRIVNHIMLNLQICEIDDLEEPLIKFRAKLANGPAKFLESMTELVRKKVIFSAGVQHLEFKGQQMVLAVFETLRSDPKHFLANDTYELFSSSNEPVRVISDHLAGMTDSFLLKTYDRLFSPRMGSVFDRL
ncbi:MAG: dGTPase, partial [Pseudomonadota bacterium]